MREEEEGKLDTDDDMVVQSTSDSLLVPSINSPKFDTTIAEEDEDEDGDRMGTPRSILTGSSKTSASSGRSKASCYHKVPKFSDAKNLCCNLPKIQTKRPNLRVFSQEDAI